jgi:hypothetical protein
MNYTIAKKGKEDDSRQKELKNRYSSTCYLIPTEASGISTTDKYLQPLYICPGLNVTIERYA